MHNDIGYFKACISLIGCLGGAVVERKVAGSTPGALSSQLGQLSLPYPSRRLGCSPRFNTPGHPEVSHCVIPYGKWHSVAVSWNTSIKGYTVPLSFTFYEFIRFTLSSDWMTVSWYMGTVVSQVITMWVTLERHDQSYLNACTVTAKSRPHWRRSRSQQNITGDFLSPAAQVTKSRQRQKVDGDFLSTSTPVWTNHNAILLDRWYITKLNSGYLSTWQAQHAFCIRVYHNVDYVVHEMYFIGNIELQYRTKYDLVQDGNFTFERKRRDVWCFRAVDNDDHILCTTHVLQVIYNNIAAQTT